MTKTAGLIYYSDEEIDDNMKVFSGNKILVNMLLFSFSIVFFLLGTISGMALQDLDGFSGSQYESTLTFTFTAVVVFSLLGAIYSSLMYFTIKFTKDDFSLIVDDFDVLNKHKMNQIMKISKSSNDLPLKYHIKKLFSKSKITFSEFDSVVKYSEMIKAKEFIMDLKKEEDSVKE